MSIQDNSLRKLTTTIHFSSHQSLQRAGRKNEKATRGR